MSLELSIKKSFPSFSLDVSFAAENETVGFLGASGCGKTLTLRCIAGIEKPDEGYIIVNGITFFDSEKKIDLSPQQRKTALLFQNYMLFPNLTVSQNIAAGIGNNLDRQKKDEIVLQELKRFSLTGFEDRYPLQLSGGQQQRVALARMLAAKPGILMLDEPFSALDAHLKGVLEQNLVSLFDAHEGTILYISHDVDEALRFCDRIAVVDAGRIVEIDTADEIVSSPQSVAGIKLSGCKNATDASYIDDHHVRLPRWGIEVESAEKVPTDVICLGVRAFFLERVDGPGTNVIKVRVDRVNDSRFDRTALLRVLDRPSWAEKEVEVNESDVVFLKQHIFWRVNKLQSGDENLPQQGDELYIRIPPDKLYLASR